MRFTPSVDAPIWIQRSHDPRNAFSVCVTYLCWLLIDSHSSLCSHFHRESNTSKQTTHTQTHTLQRPVHTPTPRHFTTKPQVKQIKDSCGSKTSFRDTQQTLYSGSRYEGDGDKEQRENRIRCEPTHGENKETESDFTPE